jgi:hypothetical protein
MPVDGPRYRIPAEYFEGITAVLKPCYMIR